MRIWHGLVAFCFLMTLAAWLVHEKLLGAEVFAVPVAAFGAWLIRQPVELRKPKVRRPMHAIPPRDPFTIWQRDDKDIQ